MEIPLDFRPVRFASETLPARERLSAWREVYGPRVNGADVQPVPSVPFRADVTLRALPSFGLTTTQSTPARYARTRRFLTDGRDYFGVHVSFAGDTCSQRSREIACGPRTAVLMNVAEAGWISSARPMQFWGLWFTRAKLEVRVKGLDDRVLQPIASDTEAMKYLIGYIRHLQEQQALADPELARIASVHLRDLFILVLGGKHDATILAQGRGLRAARLQSIKRYVASHLDWQGLTVGRVASRHNVGPRYVQRLFESEGTTFSAYVLSERLARAHKMLCSPHYGRWSITAIALEAGFGDVSYFNRQFRRRYGLRPSDVRASAPPKD